MQRRTITPGWIVWGLVGLVAVEIVVTYARLPAGQLYHVSESGAAGGFGRALVFLNFPVALIGLPLAVLSAERARGRPRVLTAALVAAALCAVIFWPGIVDQDDLDATPWNALPAAGVAVALAVSFGSGLLRERATVSPAAVVFAGLLLVPALPWLAADLGFYLNGVPVLGWLFRTGDAYHGLPSVHHGHHHGLDGVLLVLAALLTVPLVRRTSVASVRVVGGAYMGLQLAYGLANVANDAWLEQVVKRGWVATSVPSVLTPTASFAWLGIVLAGAVFATVVLHEPGSVRLAARYRGSGAPP